MNSRVLPTCLLLFFVVVVGCTPDNAAEPDQETAMNNGAKHTISLEGDFAGPIGLQLWSVREHKTDDVAGRLARVYDMGFREVELDGTHGMTPEAYGQLLDAAGLKATSLHAGYERFTNELDAVLDEAEALGVTYLGPAWIPHERGEPFTDAMARQAARDFNTWGAAAKARGLQFFYHVHGYEYRTNADGTTPFDVLVAETDLDAVKYEMDVFWVAHSGTDPAALLREYPNRWVLMHVKDMKKGTPTPDYSGGATAEADVPIGTGQINYRAVLAAAREIGLDRYYIEDESTDPLGNIPRSITFLETVTF